MTPKLQPKPQSKPRPGVLGVGAAVPDQRVTNDDLAKMVDTSDAWIRQRTGIRERRILREGELPSDLGVRAARAALRRAGIGADQIDLLITATNLPEMPIPGSSPFILEGLGVRRHLPFFDLIAGCTGFIYALKVASDLVDSGSYRHVLIVGLEALSRFTDWSDRATCVLFGDGAGAAVVSHLPEGRGLLAAHLSGDSAQWDLLHMPAGGVRTPASAQTVARRQHYLKMEGGGVFKSAVQMMETSTLKALEGAGLTVEEVDWVVPHQANLRIITAFADRLSLPLERVLINIDRYANTSTASIPLALSEAVEDGRLRPGHIVVMNAFGAGTTYGAVVLRW